jgi:DivIVA domain-containing protein
MVDPSELEPDGIARREFTTSFRGFDQVEVRAYLGSVSRRLREVLDRERELERRLAELESAQGEDEPLDEHRLTELLGEETARIFEAAREAAAEIRAKAEAKTAQLVREAQEEATRVTAEASELLRLRTTEAETAAASIIRDAEERAKRTVSDAEAEAEAIRTEAQAYAESVRAEADAAAAAMRAEAEQVLERATSEVAALREQATADAEAEVEAARQQGREMVAEAQVVRERILKDLARRRRTGKAQLEALRAARERLLDAYALVRRTVEEATTELTVAVPEAKLAAEAAGRRVENDEEELTVEAIEAELDAGRVAGVPLLDTGEIPITRIPPPPTEPPPPPVEAVDELVEPLEAEEPVEPEPALERVTLRVVDDLPEEAAEDVEELVEEVDEAEPEIDGIEAPEPDESESEIVETEVAEIATGIDVEESQVAEIAETPEQEEPPRLARVDDLFARLRSEVPVAEEPAEVPDEVDLTDAATQETSEEVVDEPAAGEEPEADDPDEAALDLRDRHVASLERDLARALKRQLADDENDKLDLIRRRPAKAVATDVLPTLEEHRATIVAAVTDTLTYAVRAGRQFAHEMLGTPVSEVPVLDDGIEVDDLAVELADSLLVPIRSRVSELTVGTDPDDALDGVRACYRQWKGQVTDLAGQFVHTAFNRGVFDAVPDGTLVRWVVDPGAGPCPDGEDDALEGPLTKGTPFPTGHLHPPAHPGCRCLLVPGVQ